MEKVKLTYCDGLFTFVICFVILGDLDFEYAIVIFRIYFVLQNVFRQGKGTTDAGIGKFFFSIIFFFL